MGMRVRLGELRPAPALTLALIAVGVAIAMVTAGTLQASNRASDKTAELTAISGIGDGINKLAASNHELASDLYFTLSARPGSLEIPGPAGRPVETSEVDRAIEAVRADVRWLDATELPASVHDRISVLSDTFEAYVATLGSFRQARDNPAAALLLFHNRVQPREIDVRRALSDVRKDVSAIALAEVRRATRVETTFMVAGPLLLIFGGAIAVGTLLLSERRRRLRIDTLEKIADAKDRFIAGVSHELRTPLTAVVGFASELDESWDSYEREEIHHLVGLIRQQGKEVANIVDDLLVAARSGASQISIFMEPLDLGEVVTATVNTLGLPQIRWAEPPSPVWVSADPTRLRQIVRNLCVNAARYGGPNVTVTARRELEAAVLEVADDGSGVDDELASHLFEPYSRGNHGSAQPASIGLGLSVSKDLATLMGGDLTYERRAGWSVFVLTFPPEPIGSPLLAAGS